ncbi:MAG TPA: hypothetical protein PK252_09765, partial [Bacteroidales bacterium]|nr:hypothetical protein [Bacteroidales bacterium]
MKTHSTLRNLAIKAIMLALLWVPGTLFAQIVYISPSGSDLTGNGSYDMPFKTLQKALDNCNNNIISWNIYLFDGTYDFDTTTISIASQSINSISAINTNGATIKNSKLIFDFAQTNQYTSFINLVIDSSSIEFSGAGTVYISDNHFKNSTYILAKNNTITADVLNSIFENSGMELNSLSATIINNTFVRSLSVTGSYAIYVPQAVNISIEGNIFKGYDYAIDGTAQNVKYNCFFNNVTNYPSSLDSSNIYSDPMLNSDFSLKPGSPCIGAYEGSDIGAITYVTPVCNFDFTYVNNYGANYTFTPQPTNCNTFNSLTWTVRDPNNILIKTSTDNIFTYTMPEIGYYTITLEGLTVNSETYTTSQYVNVYNTCPANGSMNIISADEITGLVKFKISAINTDSVFFSFGDLKDSVFKYSGTEMTFTHKYPTNWKYGNEFYPSYSLYNTLENCSIPKYSDIPVSIKNKNCRITTWAYSDTLTLSVNAEKYGNEDVLVTLKNSKGTLDNFTLNT